MAPGCPHVQTVFVLPIHHGRDVPCAAGVQEVGARFRAAGERGGDRRGRRLAFLLRRAGYGAQQRQGEALALLLRHAGHEVAAQTDPFRSSFGGRAAFDSFVVHGGLLFPFGPSMRPGSYGSTSIQSFPISLRRRFS